MVKEAKIKKTNLKLIIFLLLLVILLYFIVSYAYNYYIHAERNYRSLEPGKNVKEAIVEKEQTCNVKLTWNIDFDYADEIKLTFYDSQYNKYDYTTYDPHYDIKVTASDLGIESFQKITGVEAQYHYEIQFPTTNQTNNTTEETPTLKTNILEWLKNLIS